MTSVPLESRKIHNSIRTLYAKMVLQKISLSNCPNDSVFGVRILRHMQFIDMAGYEEAVLLGKNHNIIRHPDMPKVAFKLCWDLISSGKEFFGFVKNMSKDGGHYWVFANITPDYDSSGKIIGYTSVRRKPPQSAINAIEPIYKLLMR